MPELCDEAHTTLPQSMILLVSRLGPNRAGSMTIGISRRKLLTGVGAWAALPLTARAQQSGSLPTLGFLTPGSQTAYAQRIAACVQRLSELGWIEGRTFNIDYRWAET